MRARTVHILMRRWNMLRKYLIRKRQHRSYALSVISRTSQKEKVQKEFTK